MSRLLADMSQSDSEEFLWVDWIETKALAWKKARSNPGGAKEVFDMWIECMSSIE